MCQTNFKQSEALLPLKNWLEQQGIEPCGRWADYPPGRVLWKPCPNRGFYAFNAGFGDYIWESDMSYMINPIPAYSTNDLWKAIDVDNEFYTIWFVPAKNSFRFEKEIDLRHKKIKLFDASDHLQCAVDILLFLHGEGLL